MKSKIPIKGSPTKNANEEYLCDSCGEKFDSERFKMYDENYNVQPGLIHCGCYFEELQTK